MSSSRGTGSDAVDFVLTLLIIGGCFGAVVGSSLASRFSARPSRSQCEALLEQWSEQSRRARSSTDATPGPAPPAETAALRGRWLQGVAACERELTAGQVDCASGAPNVDELERCLQ